MKAGMPVTHKACQCEFLQGELIAFLTEVYEAGPDESWYCPLHGLMMMDGPVEKPVDLKTFRAFEKHFPLTAVELIIYRRDGHFLLVHRSISPSADMWTTPGGIILRGETFEEAAVRVARREVNMEIEAVCVGYPVFHMDAQRHSIGIPVLCWVDRTQDGVRLSDDGENDGYAWFESSAPENIEDYYMVMLKEMGFLRPGTYNDARWEDGPVGNDAQLVCRRCGQYKEAHEERADGVFICQKGVNS